MDVGIKAMARSSQRIAMFCLRRRVAPGVPPPVWPLSPPVRVIRAIEIKLK
jgi:hypothetical protein